MSIKILACLLPLIVTLVAAKEPCDSDIFCYGPLLHTVQRSRIFRDSKTFVDMSLKHEPDTVRANFQALLRKEGPSEPSQDAVRKFVEDNFNPGGHEFEPWVLPDWKPSPKFLRKIVDRDLQNFAWEVNSIWNQLGRRIKEDVKTRNHLYSMIYVDKPFVVPGGRFNEFYYWDQFWVLKGLLHSEMTGTVKGMLENFFQMVHKFGYVPNGGRIYYQRSQPPMLTPMVNDYLETTGDFEFLKDNIHTLDKEFDFWMTNRTYDVDIRGTKHTVVRYNVELSGPRPEAYNEDYERAQNLTTAQAKEELYMNIKTATESGIDFSSRWFVPKNASTSGLLDDCKARFVLPVDLNALVLRNAMFLQKFHTKLGNYAKAGYYAGIAAQWENTINAVFWNQTMGSWFDYIDVEDRRGHKTDFYPGNILPLILNVPTMRSKTSTVLAYLKRMGVMNYGGGVPSSLIHSGEQWDFPNAWAPHMHWFIESLEATGHAEAQKFALESAQKWIINNYLTFKLHNNTMFEKYDVNKIGLAGGGGEYDVVVGFGWSNGVLLDLLVKYGRHLRALRQ